MDKKSEEAALGCMLIDEIAAREGVSRLMASDFTTIERQRIFDAIREVIDEGKSPDIITVTRKSRRDAIYITELSSMIVSTQTLRIPSISNRGAVSPKHHMAASDPGGLRISQK